jgi:hypothetical protein
MVPIEHETLWQLLCDPNHWILELIIVLIVDVIIGLVIWPWYKEAILHHISDDKKLKLLQQQVKELRQIMGLEK